MSPSYLFKVVTVGSAAVGKTSMILRYVTGRFREYYAPTLGADFSVKHIDFDKTTVKLQIWDLGSQDFLGQVRAGFYPGARGVVFLFDVTSEESYEALNDWKKEVDTHIKDYRSVVVANKTDLEDDRVVKKKEGKKVANEFDAAYIETSVKLNENVDDAFMLIAQSIMDDFG
ncbi:MAG: GTP-binding protein [Candidatus Thorarchaeota archaeon]|nr:MAG: GTP-binding protein [Candidatus Thorarchaeota archaeon]